MKKCCNRLRAGVGVDENLPTPTPTPTPVDSDFDSDSNSAALLGSIPNLESLKYLSAPLWP